MRCRRRLRFLPRLERLPGKALRGDPRRGAVDVDGIPQLTPQEAYDAAQRGALIVDVREAPEWQQARIPGAMHLPLSQLVERADELPSDRPLVLQCAAGMRSQQAAGYLRDLGYDASNLQTGIRGWWADRLPLES